MKEILFWTGSISLQVLIYYLPSVKLPKGKWIRSASAPTVLSSSVETMAPTAQIQKERCNQNEPMSSM